MDRVEHLREAARVLREADLPSELWGTAFGWLLQHDTAGNARSVESGPPAPSGTPLARIAARLNLSLELVSEVFVVDGEQLELVVGSQRLHQARSRGTEQVALLVAAGRQAAGLDDSWTETERIREWCDLYRRYDAANFASTIRGMDDVFNIRGPSRNRTVRLTPNGWRRAAALVVELVDAGAA